MLNNYTLRFKVAAGLVISLSFAVLFSGFIIYQVVEKLMLKQAEATLYGNVRDTERAIRLLMSGASDQEKTSEKLVGLQKELKAIRLLKTGYYYVLDASGKFVLHPSKEGQNVLNDTDLDGKPIFKTILAMDEGRLDYRWLNAETQKAQDKVAVCKKVAGLNWSVCASLNESEIYEPILLIRWVTGGCCAILIALLAPLAYLVAGKLQTFILGMSKRLLGTSTSVSSSSGLVASSSKRIDENSTKQGAAVHETVSAVEEIKSMSERNAESSLGATAKVREAVATSARGEQAAQSLTSAIDNIVSGNGRIQKQVELTNQQLGNVVNVIREIDTKTKVINEIVFQTKLLAFNASVEAARAGEHGKGFAVVAEEVGNLARMSGSAAQEISAMLAANVQGVEKIIRETQDSIGRLILENRDLVQEGSRQAELCGATFREMGTQIKNIEELSENIANASREQAKGVEEIGRSMDHLNQILSQNERITRDISSASEYLTAENVTLSQLAHELAWSILGENIRHRLDPETEKAIEGGLKAHAEWKNRLIRVLSGTNEEKFVPEDVCKDNLCGLGKWIYGKGQDRFAGSRQFEVLRATHAEFHRVACAVLKTALENRGTDPKVLIGSNTPFDQASSVVIANLASLKFDE